MYKYERPDLARWVGVGMLVVYFACLNVRVTLYVIGCAIGLLLLLYAIFLLFDIDQDFDAQRDELENEIPFVSHYDEYRQTGIDRRSIPEKPDNSPASDNPGQLYKPCQVDEALRRYEWGDWTSHNEK